MALASLDIVNIKLKQMAAIDIHAIGMRVLQNPGIMQQLIDFNKAQLNDQGVFADGTPTGEYSDKYKIVREKAGLQTDHVDLKFTGDMQDSMVVAEREDGVAIVADTWKPGGDLEGRYPYILGLTPESFEAIRPMFIELFKQEYDNEVNRIMYGK